MEFQAQLSCPGTPIDSGSPEGRALLSELSSVFDKIKSGFSNGSIRRLFPELRPSDVKINERDPFLGSMCVGLTLGGRSDSSSLDFVVENSSDFFCSLKTDGIRYLLCQTTAGGFVFVGRRNELYLPAWSPPVSERATLKTIVDGELIVSLVPGRRGVEFQLFDTVLFNRETVVHKIYRERLELCRIFEDDLRFSLPDPPAIFTKDFYRLKDARVLLEQLAEHPIYHHKTDGLIIARNRFPYLPGRSAGNLKWKPDSMNSIDFLLVENTEFRHSSKAPFPDPSFFVFECYVGGPRGPVLFDYCFITDRTQRDQILQDTVELTLQGVDMRGCIAEVVWDKGLLSPKISQFFWSFLGFDFDSVKATLSRMVHVPEDGLTTDFLYDFFSRLERRVGLDRTVKGGWTFMRARTDKAMPNSLSTTLRVLKSMTDQFISQEKLLAEIDASKTH